MSTCHEPTARMRGIGAAGLQREQSSLNSSIATVASG
jgi:hypothetical protein